MIIWLVSYPRSGNTLTRSVFNHYFGLGSISIHGDHGDIGANPELGELVGHIEGDRNTIDLEALRADDKPHLIKTHDCPDKTMSDEDTYVHIVRDGRDSALSYHRYLRKIVGKTEVSLSDVISGRVSFGSWGRHSVRWAQTAPKKYKRFRFEEIVKDIPGFAHQLSEVLDMQANSEPFPDIEKFQQAGPGFIGTGKTGNWRQELSDHESALFHLYNGCAMRMMGYDGPEPDVNELNAYLAFWSDLEFAKQGSTRLKKEVERQKEQIGNLKEKVDYLEPKIRKRNRRINKVKALFGMRPHTLPWEI